MASLPIDSNTVDVGIFCLSLMGTNYHQFVLEASRVIKKGGTLFVAEVLSRFTDVDKFSSFMSFAGF